MKINDDIYLRDLKKLLKKNEAVSSFDYEIYEIEENLGEYCLSLSIGNALIKGIYTKTEEILQKRQIIYNFQFYLDKSNEEIKIYIKHLLFKKENKENQREKNEIKKKNKIFDFKPDLIKTTIDNMKLFKENLEEEDVFVFLGLKNEKIKLFDPIKYRYYYLDLDNVKHLTNLKKNDFIFFKNHIIYYGNILINNLTFIQKANDFQIFSILDKKIPAYTSDFYELQEIQKDKSEFLYIFGKVILKNIKEIYILIIDKYNKILKLNYNIIPNLDLFDLIFIYHCTIQKSSDNKYYYLLKLEKDSFIYNSKELILNKKISLNNYSILNVNIPDFKSKDNYYDEIILSDFQNINNIKSNNHIYVFKFKNELFNEIIPFNLKIKNKSKQKEHTFKFFINHNLMTNINIWINYKGKEKCSLDYCYYNYYEDVPFFHEIELNGKKYSIKHYNSFDNSNEIGFILINVPPDNNSSKIPKENKDKIISSKIWLTAQKKEKEIEYHTSQILNIDEAVPRKIYYSYNLDENIYSPLGNFYSKIRKFYAQKSSSKYDELFKYFDSMNNIYEKNLKEDFEKKINQHSIFFIPESADFNTFKIFANLLLFTSLKELKNNNGNNKKKTYNSWLLFIENYCKLIVQLNDLGKLLTYHQKIRIISSYTNDVLFNNNQLSYSTRFLYINDKYLEEDNAYLLAFKFNIDVINKLTDKSKLTKGYKILDSYILKNYASIDDKDSIEKTFSLINEPIQLMKYHLLQNYENFIFISHKDKYKTKRIRALQDHSNKVTFINEKILFDSFYSEKFVGLDYALPISMEFFHENSHSKKNVKNFMKKTPLTTTYFLDNKTISEDGIFIESLMGNEDLINDLKDPEQELGELMKVDYFIEENFNRLNAKYLELISAKKKDDKIINQKTAFESDSFDNNSKATNKKIRKKKNELVTLEDYENYYLINNQFIYPDSIPRHYFSLEAKFEISKGEKEYMEKYKDEISINDDYLLNDKIYISF